MMTVVFGLASAGVAFESFKFSLTQTSSDPARAKEDGPKTIGARAAGLLVGCFCSVVVICAIQKVFLGRIAWVPLF